MLIPKNLILTLVINTVIAIPAFGQDAYLTGSVTDTLGYPIQDAVVVVGDSLGIDSSDAQGAYFIGALSSGRYSVYCYKENFGIYINFNFNIPSGDTTTLNIQLGYGCEYLPGDVSNNGYVDWTDIEYPVRYFDAELPPRIDCGNPEGPCPQASPFYAAADINGNCAVNGIDVTYFASYFRHGAPIYFCPTCPPVYHENR